ncbi:armadillo-type protein [Terfezia claveryi]|nr:armadillo-type protein [Terfezia claveryi]
MIMDITQLKQLLSSSHKTADALLPVKEYLTSLWANPDKSDEFLEALMECADASRDEDWRVPIGDSGILELVADVLDEETERGEDARVVVQNQALKLCGNGCAEKDVNRTRMASRKNGLRSLVQAITNDKLLKFGIPVLYNICLDYEDTQKQAIRDGVGDALFTLLKRDVLKDNDDENILEGALEERLMMITELLVKHDEFKDSLDPSSISVLLKLALSSNLTEIEIYAYLLHFINSLLSHESFQTHIITTGAVESLLDILEDSYTRFSDDEEESETTRKILTHLRKTLIISLSNISSNKHFTEKYPLDSSPLLKKLHTWLCLSSISTPSGGKQTPNHLLQEALQTSACIMLGNVATSDEICLTLVKVYEIHMTLIRIMGQKDKDYGTVFSAVGMLRNLVLPADNKVIVGKPEYGIWQALETRWLHGIEGGIEKQVPYAVSGLVRLVIRGCKENAIRLLENADSQLDSSEEEKEKTVTRLSILLNLYAKSDEIPTKTEYARTVCEILRCVAGWKKQSTTRMTVDEGTGLSIDDVQKRIFDAEARFKNHEMIPQVLADMVSQDKWPAIRSEGIFSLGLLAAGFGSAAPGVEIEKKGARLVWRAKQEWWPAVSGEEGADIWGGIIGEVGEKEGKKKKKKKVVLEGRDFANALVLAAEVRRRLVSSNLSGWVLLGSTRC